VSNLSRVRMLGTFAAAALSSHAAPAAAADLFSGQVLIARSPVSGSTVTLWSAGTGAPKKLDETHTSADGRFEIRSFFHGDQKNFDLYLTARGGHVTAGKRTSDDPALVLLAVLGDRAPGKVVINELTTVASAFTNARFIKGDTISGNELGLQVAAGNVPNLVDLSTGGWGSVLVDPLNSTQNTTLANFDTLGSLATAFFTTADDAWRGQFLKAATPTGGTAPADILQAIAGIARESYAHPKDLYALFDQAYPQPKDGSRRAAPFVPYLAYVPSDFSLMLSFAGGGTYSAGRLMFDANGNLWSGQNWMAGSQSGVVNSIGGGTLKMSPNGAALSPPITGFTGMGVDGVGWGTAVTRDKVWVTSFNGKIGVMDFNGNPIGSESDFPFKEKLTGLMGIGVAANGDVWIADGSDNQLLYFPGGRIKDGRIVKVAGLKSPFDIVIDPQNRVWVSNSQSDTVIRFSASDPTKVDTYRVGIGVRALALDSKGNVWVVSNMSLNEPPPKIPDGASIMEQFKLATQAMVAYIDAGHVTGQINMIRPDGSEAAPTPLGFTGSGAISVPWGLNVDGNDNVWVGNMWGRSVTLLAGDNGGVHAAGVKTGDLIHNFQSGSIEMVTDVAIDPAGDVWAANNWNVVDSAMATDPLRPQSTWGGGHGITVIYGAAAPVKPPRMGLVQPYP